MLLPDFLRAPLNSREITFQDVLSGIHASVLMEPIFQKIFLHMNHMPIILSYLECLCNFLPLRTTPNNACT